MRSWPVRGGARQLLACWGVGLILLAGSASSQTNKWPVKAIAVGQSNVICILMDVVGQLRCWGANDHGQLGQGNIIFQPIGTPLPYINLAGTVQQVAVGWYHVCALLTNGSVQCWGENTHGRLGLNDTRDRGASPGEMANLPLVNLGQGIVATQLAAGVHQTCALLSDGNVKCFGRGDFGGLGYGNEMDRGDAPGTMGDDLLNVSLPPGTKAVDVVAGNGYTCVRLDNLSVTCWGYNFNDYQLLGRVDSVTSWGDQQGQMGANLTTVNLGSGRNATHIVSGSFHTCALLDNQWVRCWGGEYKEGRDLNPLGFLLGGGDTAAEPVGSGFVQIACGTTSNRKSSCCVLHSNGSLVCWGDNQFGQLGVSPEARAQLIDTLELVMVEGVDRVVQVSSGSGTTCAVFEDATAKCWGFGTQNVNQGVSGLQPLSFESFATPVLAPTSPASPSPSPTRFFSPIGDRVATLTPAPTPPPSTGSKFGIIAGVSAGGVVVLACIVYLVWRLRARRKGNADDKPTDEFGPWPANAPSTTQAPSPNASDPQLQDGYTWVLVDAIPQRHTYLQAGVNDAKPDTQRGGLEGWVCPVQVLSSSEVKEQIHLLAGQPLGTGACGQVYKCTWQRHFPGALLAIKVMRQYSPVNMKSFSYEAQLLSAVRHPNILRVYGYCLEPPSVCIITELLQCSLDDMLASVISSSTSSISYLRTHMCDSSAPTTSRSGGFSSLKSAEQQQTTESDVQVTVHTSSTDVKQAQPAEATTPSRASSAPASKAFNMQAVLRIMIDVATGLEYLHGMCVPVNINQPDELMALDEEESSATADTPSHTGVLHRDLKPANILLDQHGQAKLCDFGIARRLDNTRVNTEVEWAGTASYMAPELFAVKHNRTMKGMVTRKVDIYSLGIIMCELMCHSRVLLRPDQVLSGVRLCLPTTDDPEWRADCLARLQCSPQVLDRLCELISACWHHLHDKRPTAAQVKAQLVELLASAG